MKPKCKDCVHSYRDPWRILIDVPNMGWRYAICRCPSVTKIRETGLVDAHLGGRYEGEEAMLCSSARNNRHECGPDAAYYEPRKKMRHGEVS